MYSLFNKNIIFNISICALVIFMQSLAPKIYISTSFNVSLDFLLILLTFLVLLKDTYYIVFLGFFLGLFQDMVINSHAIGLCSFTKSLSVYYISKIKLNNNLWNRSYKIIFIFLVYFFHFMIYYFVTTSIVSFLVVSLSFLHALSALIIFYIFEKILFNSRLL